MKQVRSLLAAISILAFVLEGQATLHAQADTTGTASVSGTVPDKAGSAIPQATVAVKNEASGAVRTTTAGTDGRFTVTGLPAGVYSVDVVATGFPVGSRTGLKLASGTTITVPISMDVASLSQVLVVEAAVTLAVEAAPSQSSLEAKSAESIISSTYIRNFIASTGDYSDVLQMSPGTFSVSPNGPGLGDTKTFFRGFKDGFYNMTFDGIPFNDTNDPTHHSWVFEAFRYLSSRARGLSAGSAPLHSRVLQFGHLLFFCCRAAGPPSVNTGGTKSESTIIFSCIAAIMVC